MSKTKRASPLPACHRDPAPAPAGPTEDRRAALESMNPALRAVVLEIGRRTDAEQTNLLESRYETGREMLAIEQHPEVYGPASDLQLAAYFGAASGETALGEARRLAERYPPEKFQQILRARNPETGYRVGLKVLTVLLRIEGDAKADEVLGKAIAGSWSSKELAAYIAGMPRPAGGRRRPPARNFFEVLEQVAARHPEAGKQ
jgi:hypothetical protein